MIIDELADYSKMVVVLGHWSMLACQTNLLISVLIDGIFGVC